MTRVGSQTLRSRSHISSMTGECTYPIYYQKVVRVEKGTALIRYRKIGVEHRSKVCDHLDLFARERTEVDAQFAPRITRLSRDDATSDSTCVVNRGPSYCAIKNLHEMLPETGMTKDHCPTAIGTRLPKRKVRCIIAKGGGGREAERKGVHNRRRRRVRPRMNSDDAPHNRHRHCTSAQPHE